MNTSMMPTKQINQRLVYEVASKREPTRSHARAAVLASYCLLLLWSCDLLAANSSGLWVGEVTLNKVNETVVGFNAANQVVAPDPAVTTPVASPAHLRIILHVDSANNVRLLKSVAVLNRPTTNQQPDVALVTDPLLYSSYSSIGRRIASAAFDFGDSNAVQIVDQVAAAAAAAAAAGTNATNSANQVIQRADIDAIYSTFVQGSIFRSGAFGAAASAASGAVARKIANGTPQQVTSDATSGASNDARVVTARTNALALQAGLLLTDIRYIGAVNSAVSAAAIAAAASANGGSTNISIVGLAATNAVLVAITNAINAISPASPAYRTFIASATFQSSANIAAAAATTAALQAPGATQSQKQALANAAALKALINAQIFVAADGVVANELRMSGNLAAGGTLTGNIYLGANHPTNPFFHRRHPDHTIGYAISRALQVTFDAVPGTNSFQTAGFGVDRLTGTYREELSGLHKPLGPLQNIGLITEGTITLDRVSQVDALNR